ncbi:hypothetical protein SAMN04488132_106178 [Sediminibacterium ginsengisoli]|uniref:Uncharacterized protein n=1 Tax=Sediminibacterium ginsengisoli TaxID=413434 RepID=A0A1T4PS22_9BACT|nr:hypothetical protein SAMN04488132_106178 [Sediminibacterium ginsengisoli]
MTVYPQPHKHVVMQRFSKFKKNPAPGEAPDLKINNQYP